MALSAPYWIGIGDIHGDVRLLPQIPGLKEAAGVIVSGDLTTHGGTSGVSKVIEAIKRHNPVVLAQIGNMDRPDAQDYLDREGMGIHARGRELAPGVGVMGVGWSSPTPFGTPSEVPDARLAEWLEEAYAMVRDFPRLVAVIHNPPVDTKADRVGPGRHVGSHAVRAFLERVQPDVCLTGHIHESRGEDRLGKTLLINPGTLSSGGYVRLDVAGGDVSARLMTL